MDLVFYLVAVPAVFFTGLSKGGFGGGIAMLGTPMIALVVPPVQAAAIMLPVLILMDVVGLWNYRGTYDRSVLAAILPAAMAGIAIGWLAASSVSDNWVRILVGLIAVSFGVSQWIRDHLRHPQRKPNALAATFWGTLTGFTSFISHAGGPPFQAYVVPLKLDKLVLAGTSVVAFAVINAVKVIPYFALGQFTPDNMGIAIALMPIAVIGVLCGVWLVRRVSQGFFYRLTYAAMVVVGLKLLWDGRDAITALAG